MIFIFYQERKLSLFKTQKKADLQFS